MIKQRILVPGFVALAIALGACGSDGGGSDSDKGTVSDQSVGTAGPPTSTTNPPDSGSADTGPGDTSSTATRAVTAPDAAPLDTVLESSPPTAAPSTKVPSTRVPPTAPTTAPTTAASTAPSVSDAATTTVESGSNKTIVTRAAQIVPQGDYSFVDTLPDTVALVQTAMDRSPIVQAQPGQLFGVDVVVNEITITRVLAFAPATGTLTPGSVDSLQATLALGAPVTSSTIAGVDGGNFTTDGNLFFVAEHGGVLVIVVGKDQTSLEAGFTDFVESVVD